MSTVDTLTPSPVIFREAASSDLRDLAPPNAPDLAPARSRFEPHCHPLMQEVSDEVDAYFLRHWPFGNDKARQKYLNAGFSRVTCLYFPEARDDRIHFACRLLTLLFLIDGKPDARSTSVQGRG